MNQEIERKFLLRSLPAASLRLHRHEPLAKEVRRIARGQIDTACRALESQENPDGAFHEARKVLKKLRALLQLVAPEFGPTQLKREKARFRDAARLLAPVRDAQVRVKTLDALLHGAEFAAEEFAQVRHDLQAMADQKIRHADLATRRAVEILRQARASVQRWPLADLKWKPIQREIQRSYRKGRKALQRYQRKPTPETFHTWRKHLKETCYHLRIVRNLLPETAKQIDALKELGELAGNAQDLTVLRKTLPTHKAGVQTALLIREIDVRLPALYHAALEHGRQIYARKPRDFAMR